MCLATFLPIVLHGSKMFVWSAFILSFFNFSKSVWLLVYDVTIGYKYRCPSFLDNVFGVAPSEVHIHIRCFPLDCIPESEDEISSWLMERFQIKDQLLSNFYGKGQFPNQVTEQDLSDVKSTLNCIIVVAVTVTCIFFIFSSFWFKIHVCLVCAYLASATYFNVRPQPVLGFLKTRSNSHCSKDWAGTVLRPFSDCCCNISIFFFGLNH